MKVFLLAIFFSLFIQLETTAQTKFTLQPSQSMLMTGKGPGQDATINPYDGENCYAIVENKGKKTFTIRVQKEGSVIETISISRGETKKVTLLKTYELYLDASNKGKSKAVISYQRMEE